MEEAFFSAYIKQSRLDIYSAESSIKVGRFSLDTVIPWLPSLTAVDNLGRSKLYRPLPPNMKYTLDQQAIVYKLLTTEETAHADPQTAPTPELPASLESAEPNTEFLDGPMSEGEPLIKKDIFASTAEVVWLCPQPRLGGVIFVLNYRLKDSNEWRELTYSVKESPLRYAVNHSI